MGFLLKTLQTVDIFANCQPIKATPNCKSKHYYPSRALYYAHYHFGQTRIFPRNSRFIVFFVKAYRYISSCVGNTQLFVDLHLLLATIAQITVDRDKLQILSKPSFRFNQVKLTMRISLFVTNFVRLCFARHSPFSSKIFDIFYNSHGYFNTKCNDM